MMQLLLDGGAVPRLTQKNGNTPLMLSIRFLCSQGGLNPFEVNGERAIEAINLSLQHGVDVNAKNWESALHLALDYPKVMSLRAQHGADLGITDRQGRTVLDAALAAATPNPETIATLRSLNAPVASRVPARKIPLLRPPGQIDLSRFGVLLMFAKYSDACAAMWGRMEAAMSRDCKGANVPKT
jgi:hypothetical protein